MCPHCLLIGVVLFLSSLPFVRWIIVWRRNRYKDRPPRAVSMISIGDCGCDDCSTHPESATKRGQPEPYTDRT
jgi:hypothetical protein